VVRRFMGAFDQALLTEEMEIYPPSEAREPLSNFKRKTLKNGRWELEQMGPCWKFSRLNKEVGGGRKACLPSF